MTTLLIHFNSNIMSKDKGSKNIKKAPADKSQSKKKESDYKTETKGKSTTAPVPPKPGKA